VESFCVPPAARNSRLSTSALQLLRSGEGADMLFEVVTTPGEPYYILINIQQPKKTPNLLSLFNLGEGKFKIN
jgi:hypothetical protein